jgi:predicted hydrocarbon binding protein
MANNEILSETEQNILKVLNDSVIGMSITEIAEKTGINRMTAAKYLDVMHVKNLIDCKKVGTSKLWITSGRSLDQKINLIIKYFQMYNSAVNEFLGKDQLGISREIGIKIGNTIYEEYFKDLKISKKFSELVEFCAQAMEQVYPIPSRIRSIIKAENVAEVIVDPCLCQGVEINRSLCEMQTGIIIGFSSRIFENIEVREEECMCDKKEYCSYLIQYRP